MSDPAGPAAADRALNRPSRSLGLTTATGLVVASMVGAGVFTTSGYALADLGSPGRVLAAWVVGGVIALLGVASYSALALRIAESGGEYVFLARTVHPLAGFLAGWVSLVAGFTAPIALAAAALQAYFAPWIPVAIPAHAIGTLVILLAAVLHGVRPRHGALAQNLVILLKLLALGAFLVSALPQLRVPAPAGNTAPFDPGAFAVALVWISLSYSGWNAAVYVAGEVRHAPRNVPRAMWIGTGSVAVLYVLLNAVFLLVAPAEQLRGEPDIAAVAARALGGAPLETAARALIALALWTSISAMVMAGPRVYARMAADGLLPRLLARAGEAPGFAIAAQALLAIAVLWIATLRELLGYVGWTLSISSAATVVGLILWRLREGPERVPIRGWPWVPCAFVTLTSAAGGWMLATTAEPWVGVATIAFGLALYPWRRSG